MAHPHVSPSLKGPPIMYGCDDCIPWLHGDMERGWEKGTAPTKLPKEPRITERHFILPSDYNWATRDINLLTVVLSEFQILGRALESEPKINALLSPSSLSLYVGQVCPGSSDS